MAASPPPRVLIVGAGAVGQVYGYHLVKGGATVAFFVKDKYAKALTTSALVLHRLRSAGKWPVHFREYTVVSSLDGVAAGRWDYVIVTLASNALRQDRFLHSFVPRLQGNPVVVALTPPFSDRSLYLEAGVPADRLVHGSIVLIAWQAPIPGERTHPVAPSDTENAAIGYTVDGSQLLDGPEETVQPLVRAFNRGGLPAKRTHGTSIGGLALFAIFTTLLVGLEAAGWSFRRLGTDRLLAPIANSAGEALRVVAKRENRPALVYFGVLVWPFTLRLLTWVAPSVFPFDIERYLQYHFTKVGGQSYQYVNEILASGKQLGVSTANLERLVARNPRWASVTDVHT